MMDAEIFLAPHDLPPLLAELARLGFTIADWDWVDCGDNPTTVMVRAAIMTELDTDRFYDWICPIVKRLHGHVDSAGAAGSTTS
jgi:hypothetical protein